MKTKWTPLQLIKGRLGRLHFFIADIFLNLLVIIYAVKNYSINLKLDPSVFVIIPLASILLIIFSVRRLHDFNSSGWWSIFLLIPFWNVFFLMFLIFKSGDEEENRFGEPPQRGFWQSLFNV